MRGTTIIFIRHGETEANQLRVFQGQFDTPLTPKGEQQVLDACYYLQEMNINWCAIYCSPLGRAKQTLDIVASFFPRRKPIYIVDDIKERSFGEAEGVKINESNYRKIMNNEFNGEETEEEIIKRAQNFIKYLLTNHFQKEILVITHSHFLKACFIPYIKDLKFSSKTLNAGISVLKFNDFNNLDFAKLDINQETKY